MGVTKYFSPKVDRERQSWTLATIEIMTTCRN